MMRARSASFVDQGSAAKRRRRSRATGSQRETSTESPEKKPWHKGAFPRIPQKDLSKFMLDYTKGYKGGVLEAWDFGVYKALPRSYQADAPALLDRG